MKNDMSPPTQATAEMTATYKHNKLLLATELAGQRQSQSHTPGTELSAMQHMHSSRYCGALNALQQQSSVAMARGAQAQDMASHFKRAHYNTTTADVGCMNELPRMCNAP
jgi:hypothetical protein